jgi:hypothetical protein
MRNSSDHTIAGMAVHLAMALACSGVVDPALADSPRGSTVQIEGRAATGFRLIRNGEPFVIHGVGGTSHIALLASCGGNCIRTWDAASAERITDGKSLLDLAHEQGVAVTVGLWLGHERHGFRYDDPTQVDRQRKDVEQAVRRLRNHPAVLMWGLGNEMEGPTGAGDSVAVWREVNHLAGLIKETDPDHPVMTVVANVNPAKIAAIQKHAPKIDILGVNAYAGASGIGGALRQHGWHKPYCVTEYGLPGPWEVPQTDWKAPIEPSSREKAAMYNAATAAILADTAPRKPWAQASPPWCLGSFAFLWGHKQEATSTWFGMLLPSGEKTLVVDAVAEAWTGDWPANRAPVLKSHDVPLAGQRRLGGETVAVVVRYKDPEGDTLSYEWDVVKESTDRKEGGDAEARPDSVPDCVTLSDDPGNVTVTLPTAPGAYRLFVTVRDGKGSGCSDNWPFFVSP